jgi:hypothetical protein
VIDWTQLVESGRAIMEAPPRLSRAQRVLLGPEDEKFALGDLLCGVEEGQFGQLADEIGHNLTAANLKSYRDVAQAWPPEQRAAASWTVHRTLKNMPNRFGVIKPGMTLREAQVATGKNPADTEHPSRWSQERRVLFVTTELQDAAISKAVREELEGRKSARAAKAAVKMAEEDRSAEYREALRELREARDAKHPERASYEVIFKLRDSREYVRAVGKMSSDDGQFLPKHRLPDVVTAIRDLATTALDAIVLTGLKDESLSFKALAAIKSYLEDLGTSKSLDTFEGVVIQGEVDSPRTELLRPKTIDGTLA